MSALVLATLPLWLCAQTASEPEGMPPAAESVEAAPVEVEPPPAVVTPPPEEEAPAPATSGVATAVAAGVEPDAAGTAPWPCGTAYVLPKGRAEVGVLAPLAVGLHDDLELETRPLLDLLMPNLAVKKVWLEAAGGVVATRHNLSIPSGLLVALRRSGTGGILPVDAKIPFILALDNEAYFTRPLWGHLLVTAEVGVTVAASLGRDTLPTIDLPFVFPRMAAYYHHVAGELGVDLRGQLWGPFDYDADAELFLMPDRQATVAVEGGGVLIWQATLGFRGQVGVRAAWSELPFGSMAAWLPVADLVWSF